MAYPSLRERYRPLRAAPLGLLAGCYRGRTRLLLALLAENPSGLEIGQLDVETQMVKLALSVPWPRHDGGDREVPFREIKITVGSARNSLKQRGLSVGVWVNGPVWDGRKYRSRAVSVRVGLVDLKKPLAQDGWNGDRAA